MTFFAAPTVSVPDAAFTTTSHNRVNRSQKPPTGAAPPNEKTIPPRSSTSAGVAEQPQAAASITARVRNMLPRHRPERGGTVRKHGYWEEAESSGLVIPRIRRRFTDSHRSRNSETAGSDRLMRWNTAKEVSTSEFDEPLAPRKVFSAGNDVQPSRRDDDRKWSWIPEVIHRERLLSGARRIRSRSSSPPTEVFGVPRLEVPESDPTALAERRLSKAQRLIESQNRIRRNRRSLKESGDYLGVQGINPDTGELDFITPTDSEGSSAGLERELKLQALRQKLKEARHGLQHTAEAAADEARGILLEIESHQRHQPDKDAMKGLSKAVKWRRQTKQWSSARAPALSPITQSRRSTMPACHTPTPRPPPAPMGSSPARLIELDSSQKEHAYAPGQRVVSFADMSPHDVSSSTPDTSNTVIRTPYRQSLANVSSAALELFENGISFSRSHNKDATQEEVQGMVPNPDRQKARSGTSNTPVQDQAPHLPGSSPAQSMASDNDLAIGGDDFGIKGHFLGKNSGQGTAAFNPITQSPPEQTDETPKALSSLGPGDSSSQKHDKGLSSASSMDQMTQRLETIRKGFDILGGPMRVSNSSVAKLSPNIKSLRRMMPSQLQSRKPQNGDKRLLASKKQTKTSAALRSTTNVNKHDEFHTQSQRHRNALPDQQSEVGNAQMESRVRTEMSLLSHELAKLDKLDATEQLGKRRDGHKDQEWIDNTIRDITRCSFARKEASASTPITTTTGFDRLGIQSYLASTDPSTQELNAACTEEWLSSTETYTVDSPYSETATCPAETMWSISPSSETEKIGQVADTTSDQGFHAMKELVARLVKEDTANKEEVDLAATNRPITQPMSTSIHVEPSALRESRVSVPRNTQMGAVSHQVVKIQAPQSVSKFSKAIFHGGVSGRSKTTRGQLQPRLPGSYPEGRADDDAIADHFRGLARKMENATVPQALVEIIRVLCALCSELFSLYWTIVYPMLDAKSEYWRRTAANQATWWDGLTTILAAPAAVLACAVFVWALDLITAASATMATRYESH